MAVYNAAEYLDAAVGNILEQSFTDYELLIIDDGSTDHSREIATMLAEKDNRIRCIFKDRNDGLAAVRNISLREARGEYLLMVDADDLMERNTIEMAVQKAESICADVVLWDYNTFYDRNPLPASRLSDWTHTDTTDRKSLLKLPAFMPIRLIRSDYARQRNLRFPQGLTKQDIPVHWSMMTDPGCKIALIPEKLFHYRQHKGATSARKGRSVFSLAKVMDIVGEQLKADGRYEEYRDCYLAKRLTLLHGMYDFIMPQYKDEALQMIKDRMDDDALKFIKRNKSALSLRTRWFYGMLRGKPLAAVQYKSLMLGRSIYRRYAR